MARTSEQTFKFAVLNMPVLYVSLYTATTLIMWFGGQMILGGELQVGELTGFLSYVMQILNSFIMISNVFLLLTRSLASIHRICEVLDEPVDLVSPEAPITEVADGSVEFRDVSFRYRADAAENALEHVNLSIPAVDRRRARWHRFRQDDARAAHTAVIRCERGLGARRRAGCAQL